MQTMTPTALRRALQGVRALLLDLDGVIVVAGKAVPGSSEALNELERREMPYRIVTNTSLVSRATLSGYAAALGTVRRSGSSGRTPAGAVAAPAA